MTCSNCPPAGTVRYDKALYTNICMYSRTKTMNASLTVPILPQVRSKAQNVLFTALGNYNLCCRDIIPAVLEYLDPDRTDVTQQQCKVGLTQFRMNVHWNKLRIFISLLIILTYDSFGKLSRIIFCLCLFYSSPGCPVLSVREPLWDLSC